MANRQVDAMDGLVLLIQAIQESQNLQEWFQQFVGLPAGGRKTAAAQLVHELEERKRPELVGAIALLAHADVCDAVTKALKELGITL